MSDNYGPQQGQGGWNQPRAGEPQGLPPQGWQPPTPPQTFDRPQGFQPQDQGYQPQNQGFPQQSQGFPQQNQGFPPQQGYQPQPGQGWQGQQGPAGWQPQNGTPPKKRNLGVIITAVVVVLAIAAGVTIWLVSKKDSTTALGGQANPRAAASDMLLSLSDKDVVGVAQQLDPAEAQLSKDMSGDIVGELKRLQIIRSDVSTDQLSGVRIKTQNLTFDDAKQESVNDHVTIVKLTGGTITLTSGSGTQPFTDKIKKAAGSQLNQFTPKTQTINIADEIKKNGGEPVRIATVKRGDKWYPSIFYTLADNWLMQAQKDNPALKAKDLATPIARVGGGSPEDAVTGLVDKATKGDYEAVIGMLPPDEMGVLYDYGKRMFAAGKLKMGDTPSNMPRVSNLKFTTTDVTGGKKVSLQNATIEADGKTTTITVDAPAGKVTVDQDGRKQEFTGDNVLQQISGSSRSAQMPPQVADMIKREFKQLLTVGIVTTQVDGKWYVSPLRTFSGVLTTMLQGLQPADIEFLLQMAGK